MAYYSAMVIETSSVPIYNPEVLDFSLSSTTVPKGEFIFISWNVTELPLITLTLTGDNTSQKRVYVVSGVGTLSAKVDEDTTIEISSDEYPVINSQLNVKITIDNMVCMFDQNLKVLFPKIDFFEHSPYLNRIYMLCETPVGKYQVVRTHNHKVIPIVLEENEDIQSLLGVSMQDRMAGEIVEIAIRGRITDSNWSWFENSKIYVGSNGYITSNKPNGMVIQLGLALDRSTVVLNSMALLDAIGIRYNDKETLLGVDNIQKAIESVSNKLNTHNHDSQYLAIDGNAINGLTVVQDIYERNKLSNLFSGKYVHVIDASSDPIVNEGWALYVRNGLNWNGISYEYSIIDGGTWN